VCVTFLGSWRGRKEKPTYSKHPFKPTPDPTLPNIRRPVYASMYEWRPGSPACLGLWGGRLLFAGYLVRDGRDGGLVWTLGLLVAPGETKLADLVLHFPRFLYRRDP
jgi:hypothetical protein